jgi:hypothetical protein
MTATEVAEMRRKEQAEAAAAAEKEAEAERLREEERRAPVIKCGEDSLDAYERGMLRLFIDREEEKEAQFRLSLKMVHPLQGRR